MSRRRLGLGGLTVVAAVLYAIALVAVIDRGRPPAAPELVARARRFTDGAGRARVALSAESSRASAPSTGTGVVAFPDRYRVRWEEGEDAREEIRIGRQTWRRYAESGEELASERWTLDDPEEDGSVLRVGPGADPLGPLGLPSILADLRDVELVTRGSGRFMLTGAVSPRHMFDNDEIPIDRVAVELSVRGSGQVDRLVVRASGDQLRFRVGVRFSAWGASVRVAAPGSSAIDETPDVDEAAITGFHDAPLVQPRALPSGWVLESAYLVEADETEDPCEHVELDYTDASDDETGYLTIYELPALCASPLVGATFAAGGYAGAISAHPTTGVFAQVRIGDTVLQIETDLVPDDLAALLADLVPLDLAHPPGVRNDVGSRRISA